MKKKLSDLFLGVLMIGGHEVPALSGRLYTNIKNRDHFLSI